MWGAIAILGIVQLIDAANLRCYIDSLRNYNAVPLAQSTTLLRSPCYNSSCTNVIFTHGYNGSAELPTSQFAINALIDAKNDFKNTNVCINVFMVDWKKEASCNGATGDLLIQVMYAISAVPQSISVAEKFCAALLDMANNGFDLDMTHLMGFSLGAHLFGNTGKCTKRSGKLISRITGLDPAGPLFGSILSFNGLEKTSASTVDVIHTNPGHYGLNSSIGTVDFWPNYYNYLTGTTEEQVQPGCPKGKFKLLDNIGLCSHNRCVLYIPELFKRNSTMLASKAANYYAWAAGNTSTIATLGYFMNRNVTGNFYLTTNSAMPYGKGLDGLHP